MPETSRNGSQNKKNNKKARFYKPPNLLRQKVGGGGFDPTLVEKAETVIQDNKIDFVPHAKIILNKLSEAVKGAKQESVANRPVINRISGPIMELKASGAMFRYSLVTEIAGGLLNFLENLEELNDDGFEIIEVHKQTLETIIDSKLLGSGGREGRALAQELTQVCERYRKKYQVMIEVS